MSTGENEQGLRKIIDMTRLISLVLLCIHCYYFCYPFFKMHAIRADFTDRLLINIQATRLLDAPLKSKLFALIFLLISLVGARGKKEETIQPKTIVVYFIFGCAFYFLSLFLFESGLTMQTGALLYMGSSVLGFLFLLKSGTLFSRIIHHSFTKGDVFNKEAESFPQEERLLQNEYSINLPAAYALNGKRRKSWINIINPFRGLLVMGSPGAGKSYFVIRHVITQHLEKGFALFLYDFKFDDLSIIAYNHYIKNNRRDKSGFFIINFDDLSRTHRCNPLDPSSMIDLTDATESARTILLGLNREWIKRQGDFFVESSINFVTAIIWFLRRYRDGEFCTLPHVIELMQVEYDHLFSILRAQKEIEVLINPFITAYLNDAMEQLEGQVASAKVAMARLSSPQLYYVLTGNDLTLDINNPKEPKVLCMGNNPQKQQIYGAVLSLYISRLIKLVNKKGGVKSSLVFDEFPTIYLNNIDSLIATARSNKVSTTLGIQDFSQLKKDYGKDAADVIMNISGNIISGQVTGETAKQLSDRFGKILQDRTSFSINSNDTSISRSKQLETAIPPSKISSLSSGAFVGMVADNPDEKIELKAFYGDIINDHAAIKQEENNYQPIPKIRTIDGGIIQNNYLEVKKDIENMVNAELDYMMADPALKILLVHKQ